MKGFALVLIACCLGGCGFKFALGSNPFGAPLAPIEMKDVGGQGVGDALVHHLPAALARAGLNQGRGAPRKLTITIAPWERLTLYNTLDRRTVVFGEQFTITLVARVQGQARSVRLRETVNLAPSKNLEDRALNLARVADLVGLKLAAKLAEALE
jgi:hypothetical protein